MHDADNHSDHDPMQLTLHNIYRFNSSSERAFLLPGLGPQLIRSICTKTNHVTTLILLVCYLELLYCVTTCGVAMPNI